MTYQNLRDAAKVVLRGEFMVVNTYIKKIKNKQPSFTAQRANNNSNKQ